MMDNECTNPHAYNEYVDKVAGMYKLYIPPPRFLKFNHIVLGIK